MDELTDTFSRSNGFDLDDRKQTRSKRRRPDLPVTYLVSSARPYLGNNGLMDAVGLSLEHLCVREMKDGKTGSLESDGAGRVTQYRVAHGLMPKISITRRPEASNFPKQNPLLD